jgi:hypothetical protein
LPLWVRLGRLLPVPCPFLAARVLTTVECAPLRTVTY